MNLLFDLDGTLANAMDAFVASIDYAFDSMQLARLSQEAKSAMLGPPLHLELPKHLANDHAHLAPKLIEQFRIHHGREGIYQYAFFNGMEPTMHSLKDNGHRLFVATSKPRVYAEEIFKHFGKTHLFEGIYGSELSGLNSKKADVIRLAISQNNLMPQETIMIGDRMHDVLGAQENGIPCLGVTWGYGTRQELNEAGASAIISTWHALQESLKTSQRL